MPEPLPWTPMWVVRNNIPFHRAVLHDDTVIVARSTDDLSRRVTKYLRAIDYRPPNYRAYFETAVCRAIPPECRICQFVDDEAPAEIRAPRVLRLSDMIHFLGTMKRWAATGMKVVPIEQAQTRAGVCARCPENQQVGGCSGCVNFAGRVAEACAAAGCVEIKGMNVLQGCACCGCALKGLIFMPLEVLPPPTEHPSYCWQRTERLETERLEAAQAAPSESPVSQPQFESGGPSEG